MDETMEISRENLNKLNGWQYEEYKTLLKKDFNGKKFEIFSFILFQGILCLIIACVYIFVKQDVLNSWLSVFLYTFLIGFVFPFSWTPICMIVFGFGLDELYTKIYQHFSHKTKDYLRLKELKTYFEAIEIQIEEEAILILSKVEVETRKRIKENRAINYDLRLKRKWQTWYLRDLETVRNNCELNSEALKIVDKNLVFIKFDNEKRKHFVQLQKDLNNPLSYHSWLVWKLNTLYGRTSSEENATSKLSKPQETNSNDLHSGDLSRKNERTNQSNHNNYYTEKKQTSNTNTNSLNCENEPIIPEHRKIQSHNKITGNEILGKDKRQKSEVLQSKENNFIELPESSILKTHQKLNQLEFDFESPTIELKTTDDIPTKRTTPKYEPIIKASTSFYLELASKKMEIGMKGELLVMEYERQILTEKDENPDIKLRHKSVLDGDGFGYDILSFENGKNIYIEVKTTTGSFWSNLFFTQNEFNKMNEFDEQYYLYRICNLSLEANQGDLFIFSGKKMITSYFGFNSKMYVLTEKKNKI